MSTQIFICEIGPPTGNWRQPNANCE